MANQHNDFTYTDDNLTDTVTGPGAAATNTRVLVGAYRYDASGRQTQALATFTGTDRSNALWQENTTYSFDGVAVEHSGQPFNRGLQVREQDQLNAAGKTTAAIMTFEDVQGSGNTRSNATTTDYNADGTTYASTTGVPVTGVTGFTGTATLGSGGLRTQYGYDANGNQIRVWSPNAVAATVGTPQHAPVINRFTADNLACATIQPVDIAGNFRETRYSYDPAGRKTGQSVQQTHTNGATLDCSTGLANGQNDYLFYGPDDRLGSEIGHTGNQAYKSYDANGNLVDSGDNTSWPTSPAGDNMSRIVTGYWLDNRPRDVFSFGATVGSSRPVEGRYTDYSYDADGHINDRLAGTRSGGTSTSDGGWHYSYNDAGLNNGVQQTGFLVGNTTWGFGYDMAGRQTATYDSNAHTTWFDYNADSSIATKYVHDNANFNTGVMLTQYTYDGLDRQRTQNETNRNTAQQGVVNYTYDDAGRIISWNPPGQATKTISWDNNGNRTNDGVTAYSYNLDNSIHTAGTNLYTYNPSGDLSTDGCRTYSYDGFDRLSSAASNPVCLSAGTTTYTYDGLDRQTSITALNTTTSITYDGLTQSELVETKNSTQTRYVLDSHGNPLAAVNAIVDQLYDDGHNHVIATSRSNQSIACDVRYDPWGNPIGALTADNPCNNPGNLTINTRWYNSARRDSNTGTYQFGARTYNPATASWLTPDTPGGLPRTANPSVGADPLTSNSYGYVNGDPVNGSDPSGHVVCPGTYYDHIGPCPPAPADATDAEKADIAAKNADAERSFSDFVACGGGDACRQQHPARYVPTKYQERMSAQSASSTTTTVPPSKLQDEEAQCDQRSTPRFAPPECREAVYDFLISQGLPPYQAAAIVGNFWAESYGVSPKADSQCVGGCSRGIAQWGYGGRAGNRWDALAGQAQAGHKDPFSIGAQLDYLWAELEGSVHDYNYHFVLADLYKANGDVGAATDLFLREYENADPNQAHQCRRREDANLALQGQWQSPGSSC
jgi:RHS repeat-associated protein